jgi:hypothetical protein
MTLNVMIYTALFLILFDIYIIIKKGAYYSISAVTIRGSKKYPLVVLCFGVLLGHLFWSMDSFSYLPKEKLIEKCKAVINER